MSDIVKLVTSRILGIKDIGAEFPPAIARLDISVLRKYRGKYKVYVIHKSIKYSDQFIVHLSLTGLPKYQSLPHLPLAACLSLSSIHA